MNSLYGAFSAFYSLIQPPHRHANQATLYDVSRLLRAAQARATPIMEFYEERVLIEREHMSTPEAREHGRQFARFFQGVHAMQHLMAHALHTFSDLNLHLDEVFA